VAFNQSWEGELQPKRRVLKWVVVCATGESEPESRSWGGGATGQRGYTVPSNLMITGVKSGVERNEQALLSQGVLQRGLKEPWLTPHYFTKRTKG